MWCVATIGPPSITGVTIAPKNPELFDKKNILNKKTFIIGIIAHFTKHMVCWRRETRGTPSTPVRSVQNRKYAKLLFSISQPNLNGF